MDWIQKALNDAKITKITRKTFFSSKHESDVNLVVATYKDGEVWGSITRADDGERLYFGRAAEFVFHEMSSSEEMLYAIMRARIRANGNGRLPHE